MIFVVGMERKLRNAVYKCLQTLPRPSHPLQTAEQQKEPITYIRKAQVSNTYTHPHSHSHTYTYSHVRRHPYIVLHTYIQSPTDSAQTKSPAADSRATEGTHYIHQEGSG